ENVVDHLSTRGISAIPGERRTMEELEGRSWHLRPVENETAKVPTRVVVHQRINPPEDSVMGPPVYPPSAGNYQQYDGSQFQPKSQKGFKGDYGSYHNQQWSLPPAYAGIGALLVEDSIGYAT
ncbi:hypothetical protein Tco_0093948, partial [Tanacetum coccineum]